MGTFDLPASSEGTHRNAEAVRQLRSAFASDVSNPNVEWTPPQSSRAGTMAASAGYPIGFDFGAATDATAHAIYKWLGVAAHGLTEADVEEQLYKRAIADKAKPYDPVEADYAQALDYMQAAFFGAKRVDIKDTNDAADDVLVPKDVVEWVNSIGSALTSWLSEAGHLTSQTIYRLSQRGIYGQDEASAAETLYRAGSAAPFDADKEAQPWDYIQAAIFGRKDGDTSLAGNQWVPRTSLEWLASVSDLFAAGARDVVRWLWRVLRRGGDTDDIVVQLADENTETALWSRYTQALVFGSTQVGSNISGVRRYRPNTLDDLIKGAYSWWDSFAGGLGAGTTAFVRWLWRQLRQGGDTDDIVINAGDTDETTSWARYTEALVFGATQVGNAVGTVRHYRPNTFSGLIEDAYSWWSSFAAGVGSGATAFVRWLWRQLRQGGDADDIVEVQGSGGSYSEGDFLPYFNALIFGSNLRTTTGTVRKYTAKGPLTLITDAYSWWTSFVAWARNGLRGTARYLWRGTRGQSSDKTAQVDIPDTAFLTNTKTPLTVASNIAEGSAWDYLWALFTGAVDTGQSRARSPEGNLVGNSRLGSTYAVYRTKTFWEWATDSAVDILAGIAGLATATGTAWRNIVDTGRDFIKFSIENWHAAAAAADAGLAAAAKEVQTYIGALGEGITTDVNAVYQGVVTFANDVYTVVESNPVYKFMEGVFTAAMGGVPEAFAEDYYKAVIESDSTKQRKPFIPYTDGSDSTNADATKGTNGDINLRTYDLANVDRLFLKGNDRFSSSDPRPHIGTVPGRRLPRSNGMFFHVPYTAPYMWARKAKQGGGSQVIMEISRRTPSFNGGIIVGGLPDTNNEKTANGMMYLEDNDVYVRTGGKTINLSAIGTDVPTPRLDRLPVLVPAGSTARTATSTECDTVFGSEVGCIGLVAKNVSTSRIGDKVYLALRNGTGALAASFWTFFAANGYLRTSSLTPNPTGNDLAAGGTEEARVTRSSGTGDDPTATELTAIGRVVGRPFYHLETDDVQDGVLGIVTSASESINNFVGLDTEDDDSRQIAAVAAPAAHSISILDGIPEYTASTAPTTTRLNAVVEAAGGTLGAGALVFRAGSRNSLRRLYVCINADWWVYFNLFQHSTD